MTTSNKVALACAAMVLLVGCQRSQQPVARTDAQTVQNLRGTLVSAPTATKAAGPKKSVSGYGTFKGKFLLAGTAPAPEVLKVDKETATCAPGGKQVTVPAVRVGAGNAIQGVAVYLTNFDAEDPKWEHPSYAATKAAKIDGVNAFDQKACLFLTDVFIVRDTQTLEIKNSDPIGHNTKIGDWYNATIPALGSAPCKPEGAVSEEPHAVSCSVHPWMASFMVVSNNPYYAVTKADGSFEIPNVPAGVDLTFRVWQASSKGISKATIKKPDGSSEEKTLDQGYVTFTLKDGEVLEWEATVDASLFTK